MGKGTGLALAAAVLLASCGQPATPSAPDVPARDGFKTQTFAPWGANPFGYPFGGFPYYLPPIYTYNLGNPFAPPPLAAGPWINPLLGTVTYSVGFPWAAGFNNIPAF